jgi:hypothetical protein
MTANKINVPVLFLIFNRPDTTQQVFDEIRKARPVQLFVAADGPRKDRPADYDQCKKAREIIRQVDWECKVFTCFRNENLGCKRAVSSAIDWFFSHVEEGIILEDDCVPDQSFFRFCQELLEKYRDDERIMMISGDNFQFGRNRTDYSYYFSRYYAIWGWATWKRAWSLYDVLMTDWPVYKARKYLIEIYQDKRLVSFFERTMQETYDNHLDTWDIQWTYTCIFNHGLSITPKYNLVSNIGNTGIHTIDPGPFHNMPRETIDTCNMIHPLHVLPDFKKDTLEFNMILKRSIPNKILGFLYQLKKRFINQN